VSALVAAACSSSTTTTTTTTKPAASSTTTTTSASSKGSALLGKFQSGEHATFIATYKISTAASSALTSLTIAQQSPNSLFKGTSSEGSFEVLTTGGKTYGCEIPASGSATCMPVAEFGTYAAMLKIFQSSNYLPYFEAAAAAKGVHVTFSTKTLADIALSCLSVSRMTSAVTSGEFCVTAQGVLAYASWTGATAMESGSFYITSFSTSVPAGEFTLPATPTSIP
jgi:hypothetical protein